MQPYVVLLTDRETGAVLQRRRLPWLWTARLYVRVYQLLARRGLV